jgi:hypothetical protein
MTYQTITAAINNAAEEAAQSAIDALGPDFPEARTAWEFMEEQVWSEGGRPDGLPDFFTRQFAHDYRRHCRIILAGKQ